MLLLANIAGLLTALVLSLGLCSLVMALAVVALLLACSAMESRAEPADDPVQSIDRMIYRVSRALDRLERAERGSGPAGPGP